MHVGECIVEQIIVARVAYYEAAAMDVEDGWEFLPSLCVKVLRIKDSIPISELLQLLRIGCFTLEEALVDKGIS